MLDRELAESFDLSNSVTIEVAAASFRTTRGYAICAALLDELAFWGGEDSAEPDYEIINAIRPAMATIPGAMLLCASSPYARRGALFDAHRRHYGKNGDPVLVWKAPTRTMNPTVRQSVIDEATERDPASAASEYLAEFRSEISAFISREILDGVTVVGRRELLPIGGVRYCAFCDPSGGSSDSMTLAVAHRNADGVGVVDCLREARAPFNPDSVVQEFAALLESYCVTSVCGDRYAGEWPRERFLAHGISYEPSEKPKSDLYKEALPLLSSARVELLDHPRLLSQFASLERRTARGGRDSIDHPPHSHDDLSNSVAGVLVMCASSGVALWQRSSLPIVEMPNRADLVYASVITSKAGDMAGVAIFSAIRLRGAAIVCLDVAQGPLTPFLLQDILQQLSELRMRLSCREMAIFTSTELAAQFERLGYRASIIDSIAKDVVLPVSVASQVAASRVQICSAVLSRSSVPLSFLQGSGFDDGSPLRLAFLVGVAVGLDTGRAAA
jgi:hypothetical protein